MGIDSGRNHLVDGRLFHQLDRFRLAGLAGENECIAGDTGNVAIPCGRTVRCTVQQSLGPCTELNVIRFDKRCDQSVMIGKLQAAPERLTTADGSGRLTVPSSPTT